MNIKYFAIRSMLLIQAFFICQRVISQNYTYQLPDIGYSWDAIYADEPEAKIAAATWLRNYGIGLEEFTVRNLYEICGNRFYNLSDTTLMRKLSARLPRLECFDYAYSNELLADSYQYMPDTTRTIEEQIWRENYLIIPYISLFYNNALKKRFKSDIRVIRGFRWHYDSASNKWNRDEFTKIKNRLLRVGNDSNKVQLLLTYLSHLINQYTQFDYLKEISDTLVNTCLSSKTLTRLQKATFITSTAKLVAATDNYNFAEYIYSTFRIAQGLFLPDKNYSEYYEKLQLIRANYWNSLPLAYGKLNAIKIVDDFSIHQNRKKWTGSTYYKYLTLLAYYNVGFMKEQFYDYHSYVSTMQLKVLNYLVTAAFFHNTPEVSGNRELDYYRVIYYKTLSDYYNINLEFGNSIFAQYCAFDICTMSSDWLLQNNSIIEYSEARERHCTDSIFLLTTLKKYLITQNPDIGEIELNNQLDALQAFFPVLYSAQKDIRLWTNKDMESVKQLFIENDLQTIGRLVTKYGFNVSERSRRMLRGKLLKLSRYLSSQEPYNAYILMARADSLKNNYELDFFTKIMSSGMFSLHRPIKKELENEIVLLRSQKINLYRELDSLSTYADYLNDTVKRTQDKLIERNKLIYIQDTTIRSKEALLVDLNSRITKAEKILSNRLNLILFLCLTALVLIYAVIRINIQKAIAKKEKWRAELEASFNSYRSKIWQEFGHVPGELINNCYNKIKGQGASQEALKALLVLEEFLSDMFSSLKGDSKGNLFDKEVVLASDYINFINTINDKNYTFESLHLPNSIVPPGIILSTVKNAIVHGLKTNQTGNVSVEVEEKGDYNLCHVYDTGKGFKTTIKDISDIKSGTGLTNANNILNYFNGNLTPAKCIDFGKTDKNGFTNKVTLIIKKYESV